MGDSRYVYLEYVLEERELFKEILALKKEAIQNKKAIKENDREIRIWRNAIKKKLREHPQENVHEADITSINFDIRRIESPVLRLNTVNYHEIRQQCRQGIKRIDSLIEQIDSLDKEQIQNAHIVKKELHTSGTVMRRNMTLINSFGRKKEKQTLDEDKLKTIIDTLNSYAGVDDVDQLYLLSRSLDGNEVNIKFTPNMAEIKRILKKGDRGEYYPNIPFEKVFDLEFKYGETGMKAIDFAEEIYHELDEAKDLFENDPKYWSSYAANSEIQLHAVPKVTELTFSDHGIIPEGIRDELTSYSNGVFANTFENISRINEICNTYKLPNIEFQAIPKDQANQISKDKIMQLTNTLEKFKRKRTKLGMLITVRDSAIRLLKAQDKSYVALNNAYESFERDVEILNSWLSKRWYQLGGKPRNDTAYNGRGNASVWGNKKWY